MLACHCNPVSDRAICDLIRDGACSVDEVGRRCGAGTRCGACRPTIGALLSGQRAPEPRFFQVIVEPVALPQAS